MKKTLVAAIIGLAATASTFAQGNLLFENGSQTPYATVTYGANSGGTLGASVNNAFTAGLYWASGTNTLTDASGFAVPGSPYVLAVGITAVINSGVFAGAGNEGFFSATPLVQTINGYSGGPLTLVVVAYNGADYASSSIRGHSAAFALGGIATGLSPADGMGNGLTSFAVIGVPEPSTFALAGLGLASLLIFRRRK